MGRPHLMEHTAAEYWSHGNIQARACVLGLGLVIAINARVAAQCQLH